MHLFELKNIAPLLKIDSMDILYLVKIYRFRSIGLVALQLQLEKP